MNTDVRETLPPGGSFYSLVVQLHEAQQKASLLYEDGGVTRGSGMITSVFERDGKQWMMLNNEIEIAIDQIYAINGLFSSDYSEC